jgi:hypothetical protein
VDKFFRSSPRQAGTQTSQPLSPWSCPALTRLQFSPSSLPGLTRQSMRSPNNAATPYGAPGQAHGNDECVVRAVFLSFRCPRASGGPDFGGSAQLPLDARVRGHERKIVERPRDSFSNSHASSPVLFEVFPFAPAQAGAQTLRVPRNWPWMPAFAGTNGERCNYQTAKRHRPYYLEGAGCAFNPSSPQQTK